MTAAEVRDRDEIERVERWRQDELERAGYSRDAARDIARKHEVDLHVAVEMIERGCPPELAAKILL